MRRKKPSKRQRKAKHQDSAGGPPPRDQNHRPAKRPSPPPQRRYFEREAAHDAPAPIDEKVLKHARAETEAALRNWLKAAPETHTVPGGSSRRAGASPNSVDGIALDPWQRDVFDGLTEGLSIIVDAPTTAGKTRAVEVFFRQNIDRPGFRAAYTTPVKSLSNDKLREFRALFGSDKVGIATGDIKENLDAPIVVATLESYRNSLLGTEPDLGRTLVVFDEYHYVQDESRGSAWEEAIILTPPSCQILMLSASVGNADQFVAWLESLGEGRRCRLVRTLHRPVPLVDLVWVNGGYLLPEPLGRGLTKNLDMTRLERPLRQEELCRRLLPLVDMGLTPCIIYCGRRLATETMAWMLTRQLPPLDEARAEAIANSLKQSHDEVGALSFLPAKLRQLIQRWGVSYHHSGLAAPARIAVEALVKQGLLRYCCATMGLSLGINFSVRSAVISDYDRPGELGFTDYQPSEVLQMLGRAGRRGKDAVGFSLWPSREAFSRMGRAQRGSVSSRLRHDPTTLLGLVGRGFSLRGIETFYSKSFQAFTQHQGAPRLLLKSRLARELDSKGDEAGLPCQSPAAAIAAFAGGAASPCQSCRYRVPCHGRLRKLDDLGHLHLHLHTIKALDSDERLTSFGQIARYFPQTGGLLMARMLADGRIQGDKLMAAAELAGILSLARFKEPGGGSAYRPPFPIRDLETELEELYPLELFEEVYDFKSQNRRAKPSLREFNPQGGAIVRAWLMSDGAWRELVEEFSTEAYGVGDIMSLLFRVGTYLQSMLQADLKDLRVVAMPMREHLLRPPLDFALSI